MHELGIAQSIAKIINEQLVAHAVEQSVETITVKAGKLNAIVPESLRFHFDVVKRDYRQLCDAKLVIEPLAVLVSCQSCGIEYEIEENTFVCPECSGPLALLSGKELLIESFEVAD